MNRIIHGDRLDALNSLDANSVELIITSPPYNVGIDYANHNDNLDYCDYLAFLDATWRACERVLVHGGRLCINIPSITTEGVYKPLFADVIKQIQNIGFLMRGDIIWQKNHMPSRTAWGSWQSPSNPCVIKPYEFILMFSKGTRTLEGDKAMADITKEEFIKFSNAYWEIKPETTKKGHPVPFPKALVYRLIKFYSYKGNTILDPFAGSGTVGEVAYKTGRKYILIDNSEEYVKLMDRKMGELTRQGTLC